MAEGISDYTDSLKGFGFSLIEYVEVEIGGQTIDKHYGNWMTIWTDLTHGGQSKILLDKMLSPDVDSILNSSDDETTTHKLYIPLQFWFCRNPGLALPLIALQYHEVKINIQFNKLDRIKQLHPLLTQLVDETALENSIQNACLFCDYIFLDTDERRRFAQVSHEYLIDQVQFSNDFNAGTPVDLVTPVCTEVDIRFNHPVKELVWTVGESEINNVVVDDALLQLNGHDRFKKRSGTYFTDVQRYQHHTGIDGIQVPHIYSFALKPEEHQPSGTCNFSRIDNAVLNLSYKGLSTKPHVLRVYGVNYNVLRIMSGMGGLAYSN